MRTHMTLWLVLTTLLLADAAAHGQDEPEVPFEMPPLPEGIEIHDGLGATLQAEWLTEEERADLRAFHGVWSRDDLDDPLRAARVALDAWKLDDPALDHERVPVEWRAEAAVRRGDLEDALTLLGDRPTMHAARLRAEALELLGRHDEANDAVDAPVRTLLRQRTDDAAVLTEGVRAMLVRARVQGQPARDFEHMITLLSRAHQELDRLYWPARLVEADLLYDKHNAGDAYAAYMETLSLNPRSSDAWYGLGVMSVRGFNFEGARAAATQLRHQNPQHPLATLLEAEVKLVQDDPEGALGLLQSLLGKWPRMRDAHALVAAAQAIRYDDDALDAALARFDALSPGSAAAYFRAGRHMSLNRQYERAAELLEEAIARRPHWPQPQIELGLMEMQSGRDARALRVLTDVVELDPFNKRAANSLLLIEDIVANYGRVETEHFIVRYEPGVDEVLIDLLPEYLDEIHEAVVGRFTFTPDRKTVLEVMPNHQRFAVRITGMPGIFTIAACTGPVIAMEVPREGSSRRHQGLFDWPRVIRHEYTHTVTLAQTSNRIPHWLTEACAVNMELGPRDYGRCNLLAAALRDDGLFTLDEIKWGFVRPRPGTNDRALAYAQSAWMLQYMDETFGPMAVVDLMAEYDAGHREAVAMQNALGVSREKFSADFKAWAREDVVSWGMLPSPTLKELQDLERATDPELIAERKESQRARLDVIVRVLTGQIGTPKRQDGRTFDAEAWPPLIEPNVPLTDARLDRWITGHPDHPDLWELKLRRHLDSGGEINNEVITWLHRYAELRPVDPFPHKRLAQYWLASDEPHRAVPHLEYLDDRAQYSPVYARRLATLYRDDGDYDAASAAAMRVVEIDPYDAEARELVSQIALLRQDLAAAERHVRALTLLEPDRSIHQKRLDRIRELLDQSSE